MVTARTVRGVFILADSNLMTALEIVMVKTLYFPHPFHSLQMIQFGHSSRDHVLNTLIGHFQWGGRNFTRDADDITFNPSEGGSHVPVLRAEFDGISGDINLAERINNEDGEFQFHC
jgi:CVNH domain